MKSKILRKETLKETLTFNFILAFILDFLPFIIVLILIRAPIKEIYDAKIIYINLISFLSIVITSYVEYISRKNDVINKLLYVIYWISILFGFIVFLYYLFFVILGLFSALFPLKWG